MKDGEEEEGKMVEGNDIALSLGEGREDDRWTDSSRDEWMDESENSGF